MTTHESQKPAEADARPKNADARRLGLLLFLLLWLAYGVLMNSGNLNAFGLQQIGVEAYVERGTFYIEGSPNPRFEVKPEGDCFLYGGHIYPAKQPGQFMAGALVYFPLNALGLNYFDDYLLTSALVTFLTASLVAALAGVAVFSTARELSPEGSGHFWPLTASLSYGLGTTAFAYSGVPWHDELAAGYLTIALYLLVRIARGAPRRPKVMAACAGLMLGLTITTSMLPFLMTAVAAAYFLSLRRRSLLPAFLLGGVAGLAPLLAYNALCFGNPLLVPNLAGGYSDTFFKPGVENFLSKLVFYARMLTLYTPVFWAGLFGLALLPRGLGRERLLMLASLFALAAYILNIEADGTCQYGPRYLLPAMPFACAGIAGFGFVRAAAAKRVAACVVTACALCSALINLAGAMHGAMLCYFPHFALGRYLSEMWAGGMHSYPLAPWLLLPLCICAALFVRALLTTADGIAADRDAV